MTLSMTDTLNIAIIGAGGTGSAAARFLARDGHNVTVYERFTLDHDRGSSFGGSRIIRRTYPDALYTRLMGTAYELWAELERDAGEELFVRCGGLTFGRWDNPDMAQTEDALRVNGVEYERLTAAEVEGRWAAFRLNQEQYAIFQADSGYLQASQCVTAQMRLAQNSGARLVELAVVKGLRSMTDGRTAVRVSGGEEVFDRVLVSAGPWMAQILPALRLPLRVTRQYYAHLDAAQAGDAFGAARFPVWIDLDTNFYGFPQQPGLPGVKVACHNNGIVVDPDQVERQAFAADFTLLADYTARRLPALHGPPVSEKVCLYTNTPDGDFIIDAVPDLPGVFLCSGCSGHGFKFTVLFGRILADLAQNRPVEDGLARFRLARFAH
jgi:sarcosine oxidase